MAQPTDHDSRFLCLCGADNVRDLGGLPVPDGMCTRRGVLFRGDLIVELVADDRGLLVDRLGMATVIDLRSRHEVAAVPGPWGAAGAQVVHCPLPLIGDEQLDGACDLAPIYRHFVEDDPAALIDALHVLLDPRSYPALIHCAAGKDRTGVVSALLLELLGVPREAVVADYALTHGRIDAIFARLTAIDAYHAQMVAVPDRRRTALPETIRTFLEGLDERYGGVERWSVAHGIDQDELARFRAAVVEPGC